MRLNLIIIKNLALIIIGSILFIRGGLLWINAAFFDGSWTIIEYSKATEETQQILIGVALISYGVLDLLSRQL